MAASRRAWSSAPAFAALSLAVGSQMCGPRARLASTAAHVGRPLAASDGRTLVADAPADQAPIPAGLALIDEAAQEAILQHDVPGAVIVVGRRDGVLFRRAYGFREVEPDRVPMTLDTVFDLASLTKPIATATSIMALVERGTIALGDPLAKYVPECAQGGKDAITLRHLLLHTSGLPADIAKDDFAHGREEAVRHICEAPLRAPPGERSIYSDLGFILLGEIIRRVTSRELPDFARETIFAPLGMKDTGYLPPEPLRRRAAWTENVDGVWRAGVVHDPRAYLLGGVAGHAGLFSTADDLAIYARAILGGGAVDGRRILSARAVAAMTAPWDVPGGIRTLGWTVQSRWRGEGLSPRAIGHLGFTGTAIWIDPEKDLFTLVLTNRVHPDGTGDAKPLVARVNTIAAGAIGPAVGRVVRCPDGGPVLTGIDVLREEGFERLRGAHVGLITNASGRARDGAPTVDLLRSAPGVSLVALFTPEHGLGADRVGRIASGRDARTGLPVYSLYGDRLAPSDESLQGIDTLVFDVQDAGTRYFTYASTMRRAMQAARDHDLRFVVLDRPDPIDGTDVGGPVLVPPSRSFVNYHSLPIRHGMTIGELAYLFDADDHLGARLSVVPMRNWRRSEYWDETGLPWVSPSPNLRSVQEALLYPAVGLLEATNVSVGRGTDAPFERLGAPWIDADALAAALDADALEGVSFAPETFTPAVEPYAGQRCRGVRVRVLDRARFEPVRTGLAMARELHRLWPGDWRIDGLDRLVVHPDTVHAIEQGQPLDAVVATYEGELVAFTAKRDKYLLYDTASCARR
jgi:uncharacterized protein YbbC (DUF1343 family)